MSEVWLVRALDLTAGARYARFILQRQGAFGQAGPLRVATRRLLSWGASSNLRVRGFHIASWVSAPGCFAAPSKPVASKATRRTEGVIAHLAPATLWDREVVASERCR
jgi:hypothetical protein